MDKKINTDILKIYLTSVNKYPNGTKIGVPERELKTNLNYNQSDVTKVLNYCDENQLVISSPQNKHYQILSEKGKSDLSFLNNK